MAIQDSIGPTAPPAPERDLNTGHLLTLAGGHLVHDSFTAFLNPLLPMIVEKLGLSLTLAGSLTMFNRLPSLLHPFIGMWADRIDLRLLVIVAPAASAVAMSLIGLAPSYTVLVLLLIATGISSAALHVPGPVIVSQVSGRRLGTGMSFWMIGGELARTIGPLAAVALVSWLTLEGYYPVMVVGFITSAVVYIRFRDIAVVTRSRSASTPLGEAWRVLRRLLIPLALILVARSFLRATISTFLPLFMTSAGHGFSEGGKVLAVVEAAGVAGALIAGVLSDRVDRRMVLAVCLLVAPLTLLGFLTIADNGYGLGAQYLMLALTGFFTLATTPVIMAMVQENGRAYPATANGLYMGLNFLVGALAALLVGWLGDLFGLESAFRWSALVSLAALPIALALPTSPQVDDSDAG